MIIAAKELLPCPFCGTHIIRVKFGFSERGEKIYCCICKNTECQAEGPWDGTEQGAREAWNTRRLLTPKLKVKKNAK